VLSYEEIYFDAAHGLVRQGDRLGLVRQVECLAETLQSEGAENAIGALLDLALLHLDLGEHELGLTLLARLLRNDPSDIWSYNLVAMSCGRLGLPSLARLAAERGLHLIDRKGDAQGLSQQLREFAKENESLPDRADGPAEAAEQLRTALHLDFDAGARLPPAKLVPQLVPEVASARVKKLPPMPDDASLSATAAGLRAISRQARLTSMPSHEPPAPRGVEPPRPAASARVGRNAACPCGSGKKFKKCCGTPAAPSAAPR
jgi:hypothetical protein